MPKMDYKLKKKAKNRQKRTKNGLKIDFFS